MEIIGVRWKSEAIQIKYDKTNLKNFYESRAKFQIYLNQTVESGGL